MSRLLPPPIKPRKLVRRKNPIFGFDYFTSDNRYKITPNYGSNPQGGRTAPITEWEVKDLRARPDDEHTVDVYPTLGRIGELYCAPGGKVPWLLCDMDDGIVRVEPTRKALVKWARRHHFGEVISREQQGEGWYEYFIGANREDCAQVWIARADVVHRHGFDPVQQPLYPYPDDPFEHVDRPKET